jgi:hypothetical protein
MVDVTEKERARHEAQSEATLHLTLDDRINRALAERCYGASVCATRDWRGCNCEPRLYRP